MVDFRHHKSAILGLISCSGRSFLFFILLLCFIQLQWRSRIIHLLLLDLFFLTLSCNCLPLLLQCRWTPLLLGRCKLLSMPSSILWHYCFLQHLVQCQCVRSWWWLFLLEPCTIILLSFVSWDSHANPECGAWHTRILFKVLFFWFFHKP